jgi:DNA polymerase I-like protein with 3'-5' exonuclease and polymerase domains
MEARGVGVDASRLMQVRAGVDEYIQDLTDEARRLTDNPDFNPGSSKQLSNFLFNIAGLPPVKVIGELAGCKQPPISRFSPAKSCK